MRNFFLSVLIFSSGSFPIKENNSRTPASLFGKASCRELLASLVAPKRNKSYGDEEYMMVNGVELDVTPLKRYIRSSSLNKKLRNGEELTSEELELEQRLRTTLSALPDSERVSFRKITAQAPHNTLEDLLEKYAQGNVIKEAAFTSVALSEDTKVWGDILRADIIMEIEGKTLKDISQVNELENEGIFMPGTRFRVKEVIGDYEYNETVEILEDGILDDEIEHYKRFFEKYEELFEEVAASDMNDKFTGLQDMDYGRFKPVEMNNWDDLIRQKIIPIIRIKLEEVPDSP